MAQVYRTVVGNTAPNLVITLKRNGTVIDLTSATSVKLAIRYENNNTTTNTSQACAITTPASGIVTYTPLAGDFPREGRYLGDALIAFAGGASEHVAEILVVIARAAIS
jgi:hypothetical protein